MSMIDSASQPPKLVIYFRSKNLTPSPADENKYLLHLLIYNLLI